MNKIELKLLKREYKKVDSLDKRTRASYLLMIRCNRAFGNGLRVNFFDDGNYDIEIVTGFYYEEHGRVLFGAELSDLPALEAIIKKGEKKEGDEGW